MESICTCLGEPTFDFLSGNGTAMAQQTGEQTLFLWSLEPQGWWTVLDVIRKHPEAFMACFPISHHLRYVTVHEGLSLPDLRQQVILLLLAQLDPKPWCFLKNPREYHQKNQRKIRCRYGEIAWTMNMNVQFCRILWSWVVITALFRSSLAYSLLKSSALLTL